ncbi:MAG: hypothetical protein IJS45_05405 [Clostridia bacterium]|nr:hypothetical protein [Clostridia bacterium]
MKVFKRMIAAALFAVMIFSLTSCLALDDAKAHQMKWVEGEDKKIEFGDKTYVALLATKLSTKYFFKSDATWRETYRLTEPDVPVLLKDRYGLIAGYDKELDLIRCAEILYCTEDKYDEYYKLFTTADLSYLSAFVNIWDEKTHDMAYNFETLPKKTCDEIFELTSGDDVVGKETGELIRMAGMEVATLYRTTEDCVVVDTDPYFIYSFQGVYYVMTNNGNFYKLTDSIVKELEKHEGIWYSYYITSTVEYYNREGETEYYQD